MSESMGERKYPEWKPSEEVKTADVKTGKRA
jgi:hypothetical protein